jgi:hypothetical protein
MCQACNAELASPDFNFNVEVVATQPRPIERPVVAKALTIIGVLELVASPIAGYAFGSDSKPSGWLVFFAGIISGFILLGFSAVIQNTSETAQRLGRIETFIERR